MAFFFRLCYRYKVYNHSSIYSKGAIIAPNHTSYLDPPLIGISWPQKTHYLAKGSLFRFRILRWMFSFLPVHPIQGSAQDLSSFKIVHQLIRKDQKVVIFPEGGRSDNGQLKPIKTGVAMLALKAQCPIIPVYIYGAFEVWPKGRRWPRLGGAIGCVFGRPIFVDKYLHLDKREARQMLSEQLRRSLENLRLWYERGAQGEPP